MNPPDVVIVGAGAAGIGAAHELQARGLSFIIVEAADRIGGRACTDSATLPVPWDHGCHWFHSADVNPLVAWAERLGAEYVRQKRENHFVIFTEGGFAGQDELSEARAAMLGTYGAIEEAAARGLDVSITEILPDAGRWKRGVRCILQAMAGDDPEYVSVSGYAEYEDTDTNWPVLSGYGDLIARMAAGLPVRLGVRVTDVEQKTTNVRVDTTAGPIEAGAAIVTASTNVLSSGAIRFSAGVARDLLDYVHDVPCGAYEKVAFALHDLPSELVGKLFCMVDPGEGTVAIDFQVMPTDPPVMIAHLAGDLARQAGSAGKEEMIVLARDRLALAFGETIHKQIIAAAVTDWSGNPFVQGSYSHARPGTAHRRHEMINADTGNVAFAGEAFSPNWQATAHGAYTTGREAAARISRLVG